MKLGADIRFCQWSNTVFVFKYIYENTSSRHFRLHFSERSAPICTPSTATRGRACNAWNLICIRNAIQQGNFHNLPWNLYQPHFYSCLLTRSGTFFFTPCLQACDPFGTNMKQLLTKTGFWSTIQLGAILGAVFCKWHSRSTTGTSDRLADTPAHIIYAACCSTHPSPPSKIAQTLQHKDSYPKKKKKRRGEVLKGGSCGCTSLHSRSRISSGVQAA